MAKVSIEQLTQEFDRLVKLQDKYIANHQLLQKSSGGKNFKEYVKNTEKLTTNTKNLNKVERDLLGNKQELKQIVTETNKLNRNAAEIARLQTKSGQQYIKQIKEQRAQLRQLRGTTNNFARSLVRGAVRMTAYYVGFRTLFRIIKAGVQTFVDFQKAQSKLASILGTTSNKIKILTKDAQRLGAVTKFTASEVSGLQTELAKLGFTRNEILNATESILSLAAATDTDLSKAAQIAGSSIRAFGLEASEASRIADVFAASTSKSALDMEKLSIAIPKVAPVAKQFGFSLEGTVALLGKLADSGFEASTMGTALRKILLTLADSNGDLAKTLGRSVNNFDDLIPALIELRRSGIDLNGVLELTDVRSVAAFSTFLDGAESAKKLKDSLMDVQGVAKEMAETQLDNLAGDMIKAKSAWDGFILSLQEGDGELSNALRKTIQLFNDAVNYLTDTNDQFAGMTKSQIEAALKAQEKLIDQYVDNVNSSNRKEYQAEVDKQTKIYNLIEAKLEEINSMEQEAREAKVEAERKALEEKDNIIQKEISGEQGKGEGILKNLLKRLNKEHEAKEETLKNHEEYLKKKAELEQKYAEATEKERIRMFERERDQVLDKVAYYSSFAEDVGGIIGNFLGDSEISFKQFAKNMLITSLEFLKKTILLIRAKTLAESLSTPDSIATFGVSGLARFAIINGLISAAFAGVEAAVNKFHEGEIDIRGRGDEFPAILKKGESVIKPESTSKHKSLLSAVNMGLSDAEVFNAMLSDMNRPLQVNEFRDDRLLRQMELNNKHTKRLIEIQEDRPEINYLPGKGFIISHKNKTIILKRG